MKIQLTIIAAISYLLPLALLGLAAIPGCSDSFGKAGHTLRMEFTRSYPDLTRILNDLEPAPPNR